MTSATEIQEKLLASPMFATSFAAHKEMLHHNAIRAASRILRGDDANARKFFELLEQWSLLSENYAQQVADGGTDDVRAVACGEMKSYRDSVMSVFPAFSGEFRAKIEGTIATLNKDLEVFCREMVVSPHTSARVRLVVEERGPFYASRVILL